jgi:hypothetical protein
MQACCLLCIPPPFLHPPAFPATLSRTLDNPTRPLAPPPSSRKLTCPWCCCVCDWFATSVTASCSTVLPFSLHPLNLVALQHTTTCPSTANPWCILVVSLVKVQLLCALFAWRRSAHVESVSCVAGGRGGSLLVLLVDPSAVPPVPRALWVCCWSLSQAATGLCCVTWRVRPPGVCCSPVRSTSGGWRSGLWWWCPDGGQQLQAAWQ